MHSVIRVNFFIVHLCVNHLSFLVFTSLHCAQRIDDRDHFLEKSPICRKYFFCFKPEHKKQA